MLDELDALMERMLALPVTDLEENPSGTIDARDRQHLAASLTVLEPPPPPPTPPLPPLSPPPAANAEPLETPIVRVDPSSAPAVRGPRKQPPAVKRAEERIADPATEPANVVEEVSEEDLLPPLIIRRPAPSSSSLPPRRSRGGLWLQPLLWINQVYDGWTHWLGPAGQWLRNRRGRTLLGLAGLTLLGLAAFWFLRDWLGWNR